METAKKKFGPPIALRNIRLKYYKTFIRRVAAKTGHLPKPETDKKIIARLQAEIEALSFKFRSVFDSSRSYYIILDTGMNILDFNRASSRLVKRLFGKKMIIGNNMQDFLHPSSAKTIMESCARALAGEKIIIERKIGYTDYAPSWWSLEFSPAKNLRGRIKGLVFNANDITKRKAFEEKAILQHKKLMQISAMHSHDIRGPVCTIMGLMSLIKEDGYVSDRKYLLLLETATDLLDKNIHDIVNRANDD